MIRYFRYLLFPFSVIYGLVLIIRNYLYKLQIFHSSEFDIPTICVGNLAMGGTGKTPHVAYLIQLLRSQYKPAVLSRGYMRKTRGYVFANPKLNVIDLGDEPTQLYQQFNGEIPIAVCENRVLGIPDLLMDAQDTDVIILDDAFQHRALTCGLNILLTDFNRIYTKDFLFPVGNLREYAGAAKRANIIIATKCPDSLTPQKADEIRDLLQLNTDQKLFFSGLKYGSLKSVFNSDELKLDEISSKNILLFCGIANPEKLEQHMSRLGKHIDLIRFSDHREFSSKDIERIFNSYKDLGENSILVCTEKDAVKIRNNPMWDKFKTFPLYFQPIEVYFFNWNKHSFDQIIYEYISQSH